MSDSIREDDIKFNKLFVKQYSDSNSVFELLPEPEDSIEKDDMKMDDLLLFQAIANADKVEHNSIEEKYEEEIAMDEVVKQLDKDIEVYNLQDVNLTDDEESEVFDMFGEFFGDNE